MLPEAAVGIAVADRQIPGMEFAERSWGELARRDEVKMPDRTLNMFAAGIFSEWPLPKRVGGVQPH